MNHFVVPSRSGSFIKFDKKLAKDVVGTFDVVLCMGPVYNFTEEADRVTAIEECVNYHRDKQRW